MIELDPKIQRIIDWRESFVTLPDNHFFEIIRMYLGEIHSPFNKQKLVEELGAFLRKEENRRVIVSLLSDFDLQVLSAINLIQNVTQEKLAVFFSENYNFATLYDKLLNLEERLLIYRHIDKKTQKQVISLNPTLEDTLIPLLNNSILLPLPEKVESVESSFAKLSPELIAAFASFISKNPDLCKADGNLKKRAISKISEVFTQEIKIFQYLINALINLSILKENSNGLIIDKRRFKSFALLDEKIQYAYLCVTSYGHFSRNRLVNQAKLLLECISSIPKCGYSRSVLLKKAFLISEKNNDSSDSSSSRTGGRFASLLARERESESETENINSQESYSIMDRLIDCAEVFGILDVIGIDKNGEKIYTVGTVINCPSRPETEPFPKVLNVDASFTIMIFPGLPLKALLPLMNFMDIKKYDTAAIFEINRKTAMRAFDYGMKLDKILLTLEKYCSYEIPQNLKMSLEDWQNAYASSVLYKGYVLKVKEENCVLIENNPTISQYISEVLAPGIYLLSVQNDEEAEELIKNSNLDYIGSIRSAQQNNGVANYPSFIWKYNSPEKENDTSEINNFCLTTEKQRAIHFDNMRSELEKMPMTKEQKDGLLLRINRKIILTPAQLNRNSVKLEQIEANGMDFQGKVHVAESAITQNMMLELIYDDENLESGKLVILGTPISIEKNPIDIFVKMIVEPEKEERSFSIKRAKNIRRLRGYVLKR